jgi:DNA polymerase-3 subunit alpha
MKSDQHNYKISFKDTGGIYSENSHSAAYSLLAYQTAYLKYHYPKEFFCNLLSSEIDNNDKNEKLDDYIAAANKINLKYLGVDFR